MGWDDEAVTTTDASTPTSDRTSSPFRLDLTGTWKCKHVSRAADRDQNSTRVWAWSGS